MEAQRVVDDQWHRYVRARDNGHLDYIQIADRCNSFYVGDQWDPAVVAKLEEENRPALTINMVLSTVNAVLGEQAAKRSDFKYKPRNGGREDTASVLTKLVSSIKDKSKYDWCESQVFSDGIIQHGRGFFDIRVKFDTNMMGDISIKSKDPRNIIIDPDAKEYDIDTWKEVFETRWVSIDEIEAMYGQAKADELRTLGINANRFEPDSILWEDDAFGDARKREEINDTGFVSESEEKTIRAVRIVERQHVKMTPVLKFVDPATGDMKKVPETWTEKKAQDLAKRTGMYIVKDVDRRIRWTTTADKVLLHDDWSPYQSFTIIPFFAYFRRGKPFGLVTNLISPQEQLNKLSSQELHIINTTANSGWIVERGALANMTPDELRNSGAETGIVIEANTGRKDGIEKIKPNQIPTGIDRVSMKSAQFIKEISGVNEAMLGFDSAEVSGVALEQKAFRGQIQMQVPFDNLQRTRHMVSRKLIELIQQFYTEERVFQITTEGNVIGAQEDAQTFIINQQTATGEIINDVTVGEYDVVLSHMPARDSFDDVQFAEALALRSQGIMIPDEDVIIYSHLDKKFELADKVKSMMGRGELTEQEIAQLEFEQSMMNQMALVEFEKAQAEVGKLEAESMKLAAEAEQVDGGMDAPEMRYRYDELEVRLQIARENLRARAELARLAAQKDMDKTVLNTRGQIIQNSAKEREQRRTQLLAGAQKGEYEIRKAKAAPRPTGGRNA